MLDLQVRKWIDPILNRMAICIADSGISANTLTWTGFFLGILGGLAITLEYFWVAFGLISLNRILDGLDGCVARVTRKTDLGGYLDIVLDMIFYACIPFAFAVIDLDNALPATFLIFSFIGTGSSFLGYAVISNQRGVSSDKEQKKSFFYSFGLIEGTETVVFLLLICIIPESFPTAAWIMGTLCWLTTAFRVNRATIDFQN